MSTPTPPPASGIPPGSLCPIMSTVGLDAQGKTIRVMATCVREGCAFWDATGSQCAILTCGKALGEAHLTDDDDDEEETPEDEFNLFGGASDAQG